MIALPNAFELILGRLVRSTARLGQFRLKIGPAPRGNFVSLLARDLVQLEQVVEVTFANRFAAFDGAIKHWLGEGRFITLVMPEPPISVHVNDHVTLEFESKVE